MAIEIFFKLILCPFDMPLVFFEYFLNFWHLCSIQKFQLWNMTFLQTDLSLESS